MPVDGPVPGADWDGTGSTAGVRPSTRPAPLAPAPVAAAPSDGVVRIPGDRPVDRGFEPEMDAPGTRTVPHTPAPYPVAPPPAPPVNRDVALTRRPPAPIRRPAPAPASDNQGWEFSPEFSQ